MPVPLFSRALSSYGCEVYKYHFNCPNPWPGPWKGVAVHGQDVVWALQNYNDHLPHGQREAAELMAKHMIAFVNGEAPYPEGRNEGAMVYDTSIDGDHTTSKFAPEGAVDETRRRQVLLKLDPSVLDKVLDAWHDFMLGRTT